ncbi:MAG TPA: VWA domain-containing protein [Polyangia bacterium]|nr:VWA domain-containing protein [Polyangia bacterium]
MAAQTIPDVQLIDNSEQRTPLALVLDCSGSMDGAAIDQLNQGLALLEQELKADSIASKRVRLLVLEFGGQDEAKVAGDWIDAMEFTAPKLTANGTTPTGQAVDLALAKIEEEKARFKQAGVAYTRPWLFLMSDGVPTDDWQAAADRCRQAEKANKVAIFPIAVGDSAHADTLGEFSGKGAAAVKRLTGLKFRELFLWLSASMKVVSQSRPGGQIQLPTTDNWSNAPT